MTNLNELVDKAEQIIEELNLDHDEYLNSFRCDDILFTDFFKHRFNENKFDDLEDELSNLDYVDECFMEYEALDLDDVEEFEELIDELDSISEKIVDYINELLEERKQALEHEEDELDE